MDWLQEPGTLWIHSVPQAIVDSVSDQEKRRQEAINEVIYTERDFVRDMEYLRDVSAWPSFPSRQIIDFYIALDQTLERIGHHPRAAAHGFLGTGFLEYTRHHRSQHPSSRRAEQEAKVIRHCRPGRRYSARGSPSLRTIRIVWCSPAVWQIRIRKGEELKSGFRTVCRGTRSKVGLTHYTLMPTAPQETERRPESRKLELNGYLTKPTTRLARYPLLLEAVLKHTPEDNPDKQNLPKVVEVVREFLRAVNAETGKAENRFNLLQLDQQLVYRQNEFVVRKVHALQANI